MKKTALIFLLIISLILLPGCGSAISGFIGEPRSTAVQVMPPLAGWSDQGMTISPGRNFSSAPGISADTALSPKHRVLTSSQISADISMNQSRGQLK
ncbi:MAG: hypothetical protein EOP06_01740 [Proteobacteria bacterium]|nr:MAG: hypothetical protein EOP06_01740 [Pseudomonadota bacterium]